MTRTPIDKDEMISKIDDMMDIVTNKLEYLGYRYELDALKFFGGYLINYTLIIEMLTYLGVTLYTIFQEISIKWVNDADIITKEK